MKKYIVSIILASVLFVSCEEERVFFNQDQTFVNFTSLNVDLPVVIDATGSTEVTVTLSSASESERTIDLSVVQEETTAGADSYTFGSIVVPANSYEGTLTIDGVDNNVTPEAKKLVLALPENSGFVSDGNLTVNIFQVCPIDETLFTGMYLIEQTSAFLAGPSLSHNTVVEVTADGLTRSFQTSNFPNFCSTPNTFTFNLVCNEFVVPLQFNNCNCGDGVDYFGPALTNAVYSVDNDDVFEIVFSDDTKENCGSTGQTVYRFTKQ
ncbi:MAG: hypothetical protein AB3N18_07910 [Allomuricauda sp.]